MSAKRTNQTIRLLPRLDLENNTGGACNGWTKKLMVTCQQLLRLAQPLARYELGRRPSKLETKNWQFIGHPDGGDRTAIIYSLIVST